MGGKRYMMKITEGVSAEKSENSEEARGA